MTNKPNFGGGYDGLGGDAPVLGIGATTEFDSFVQKVNSERASVYGHPFVDFGRVSQIKSVVEDCPDPRLRHVLEMIATKMCRLIESPTHIDSWVDIAGYARTACMVIDAQQGADNVREG